MRQGESVLQRRVSLAEMLDADSFTEVVKGFVELYRVGIKVFDEKGGKLADIKINNGDFCGYVFSFPEGRRRCTATVGRVKDGPVAISHGARLPVLEPDLVPLAKGMVTVPCFTGLRYLIVPILWEGDAMGRVVFGPFMPDDLGDFPPRTLTEISEGFDLTQGRGLVDKVRRAPEGTIARVMLHFGQLLQTMLFAGQKMFLTSQLHIEATLEQNKELEERNQSLEEANTRLKELDRLKSSFLATVSHELRTPLTSIIGYSEMLAEGLAGPLNEEQVDYVRTIMDKGETLLKLISSILDISQIEAGKVRLNFEPMDVIELVNSSVSSLKPQAQKKGVALEAKVPGRMPQVTGDRDRLRQVLVNLLANAVKFTPRGGRVTVTATEVSHQPDLNADGFRLIVEDSGVGIPADQFDKIFQSFYQVDSSSTREYGGAGLGLAIVKSFVEGHGGVVRLASEMGHGSRFTLIFPVSPGNVTQVQINPPVALMPAMAEERF
jgi:signal transduction histidine kinase